MHTYRFVKKVSRNIAFSLLISLTRNAQLELKRNKPPKSSRALFRYLAQLRRDATVSEQDTPTE